MRDIPTLDLTLYSIRPDGSRDTGQKILEVLMNQGGIYLPEECEIWVEREKFVRKKFSREIIDTMLDEWEGVRGPLRAFNLLRSEPTQTQFMATVSNFLAFDHASLSVELSYFDRLPRIVEFLEIGKRFYNLLSPAFGMVSTLEMQRIAREGPSQVQPGVNVFRQGLPDVFWANFFGPEYVDMFGRHNVLSAPCYKVEDLQDRGALLILTESPGLFETNASKFDEARDVVREHLGDEAFYRGNGLKASRFPKFRFWDERQKLMQKSVQEWKARKQNEK